MIKSIFLNKGAKVYTLASLFLKLHYTGETGGKQEWQFGESQKKQVRYQKLSESKLGCLTILEKIRLQLIRCFIFVWAFRVKKDDKYIAPLPELRFRFIINSI